MLGYSEVITILLYLIRAVTALYSPLLGLIWEATVKYGLEPGSAFPSSSINSSGFLSLYSYIYKGSIPILVSVLIAGSALLLISPAGNPGKQRIGGIYIRMFVAILISVCSLLIFTALFQLLGFAYDLLFNHAGPSISSFSQVTGISPALSSSNGTSILLVLMRFLLLSAYFLAVGSVFSILIFRQALLIVFVLVMPFLTILSIMDIGQKYARMGWELAIELTLFQFAALLSIMLAVIFRSNVPLNLAFLFLPSILPGYLLFSGRGLASAPVLGFLGGMTLGSSATRIVGMASAVADSTSGGNPFPFVATGALLPAADYRSIQGIKISRRVPSSITEDAVKEELKYRKDDY